MSGRRHSFYVGELFRVRFFVEVLAQPYPKPCCCLQFGHLAFFHNLRHRRKQEHREGKSREIKRISEHLPSPTTSPAITNTRGRAGAFTFFISYNFGFVVGRFRYGYTMCPYGFVVGSVPPRYFRRECVWLNAQVLRAMVPRLTWSVLRMCFSLTARNVC